MMNLITLRHLATLNPFDLGIRKPMPPQIRLIQTLQELLPLRPVELPPQPVPSRLISLGEDKIIHHAHACDLMDLTFENALEITTRLGHLLQIRLHKLREYIPTTSKLPGHDLSSVSTLRPVVRGSTCPPGPLPWRTGPPHPDHHPQAPPPATDQHSHQTPPTDHPTAPPTPHHHHHHRQPHPQPTPSQNHSPKTHHTHSATPHNPPASHAPSPAQNASQPAPEPEPTAAPATYNTDPAPPAPAPHATASQPAPEPPPPAPDQKTPE